MHYKMWILILLGSLSANAHAAEPAAVLDHYADLAQAMYEDSLASAKSLREVIDTLASEPSVDTLAAAREAWKAARVPYQQTEAYRFGNAVVDDWEGKVNAWPLDEGLIDYVSADAFLSDDNPYADVNVIANESLTLSGNTIDASSITPALLSEELHEVDGIEANVATGYHAIEFLLWGQDLNGTEAGAGNRPATDFDPDQCTGGHCQRRIDYLKAATELLIDDLGWIVGQWQEGGPAREALTAGGPEQGLSTVFTGMGSLSYGELAGERMKLGLMLHDPEEEHDCFSDNTHWSHYHDALGIRNVYTGEYRRIDGTIVSGPSVSELVAERDPELDKALRASLDDTLAKMQAIVDSAEEDQVAYDQLIAAGNEDGNALVQAAIDALLVQTKHVESAVEKLGLGRIQFEGSDSLDAPDKVIQ